MLLLLLHSMFSSSCSQISFRLFAIIKMIVSEYKIIWIGKQFLSYIRGMWMTFIFLANISNLIYMHTKLMSVNSLLLFKITMFTCSFGQFFLFFQIALTAYTVNLVTAPIVAQSI